MGILSVLVAGVPPGKLQAQDETPFGELSVKLVHSFGQSCLLYTSDAADERSSVDLGGRRIIKKKKQQIKRGQTYYT